MSQPEPSVEPIHVQITGDRAQAWDMLHRLATDETFYQSVAEDPEQLFGPQGITLPNNLLPDGSIELPPRAEIQELLDQADNPFDEGAKPPLGFAIYMMAIAWGGPAPPGRPPGPGPQHD